MAHTSIADANGSVERLRYSHGLRLHNTPPTKPVPYLDVFSIQSRRLLSITSQEVAAHEQESRKRLQPPQPPHHYLHHTKDQKDLDQDDVAKREQDAKKLEELIQSVHLLLEPIQLPDLSHTGVVDAPFVHSASTLPKFDQEDNETKLFYPTGAKNANMREYIKDTIHKHLHQHQSTGDSDVGLSQLSASQSAPALSSTSSVNDQQQSKKHQVTLSPSPNKSKLAKKKAKAVKSPVKASISSSHSSLLLNPELTKQAKDIIAAVRANSSKINELIGS